MHCQNNRKETAVFVYCRRVSLNFSQLFNEPYEGGWHFSKLKEKFLERTLSINQ